MDGYRAAPVDELTSPATHLFTWLQAGGHGGGAPWLTDAGRPFLEDAPTVELPEPGLHEHSEERDPDDDGRLWMREDGDGLAAAAWEQQEDWWLCISAARWATDDRREGYSFWGTMWADAQDGYRYIIGPHRPLELAVDAGNIEKPGGERGKAWWRFSLLVWTFQRLLNSPAPGIRRFPIVQ